MIGEGKSRVVVEVLEMQRGKVRLGITADRSVGIWREELLPLDDRDRRGKEVPVGDRA